MLNDGCNSVFFNNDMTFSIQLTKYMNERCTHKLRKIYIFFFWGGGDKSSKKKVIHNVFTPYSKIVTYASKRRNQRDSDSF
jgi:hypothetical protein